MIASLALIVLLAQSPPEPSGPLTRAVHIAIAAHVVAQFADISTTQFALGTGQFTEANPLLRWASHDPIPMALTKGLYATGTAYLLLRLHRTHPRLALSAALLSTALTGYVAHRNAQAIRRQ